MNVSSGQTWSVVDKVLRNLSLRSPNLKGIALHMGGAVSEVESGLVTWLRATPSLVSIELPDRYHTEKIVAAMGSMQELRTIRTSWKYERPPSAVGASRPFPDLPPPLLENMDLCGTVESVTAVVLSCDAWSALTTLGVSFPDFLTADEVMDFNELIAQSCERLVGLELNLRRAIINEDVTIRFDQIRPLLVLKSLESFSIAQNSPFDIYPEAVLEMAAGWPKMKKLWFSADPDDPTDDMVWTGSGITVIEDIARHLPQLTELGIYWNVENNDLPEIDGSVALAPHFSGKLILRVGYSRLHVITMPSVGVYLGHICGPRLEIQTGRSPWNFPTRPAPEGASTFRSRWKEVERLAVMVGRCKEALTKHLVSPSL